MMDPRKDQEAGRLLISAQPIFVHSSFRVSSTWFWTKLRRIQGLHAYYEIFHERLATLDSRAIQSFTVESWDSGHPKTAPYFEEYEELLSETGGVRKFAPEFSYNRFIPAEGPFGDISEGESSYVHSLITHAQALRKRPVLTCGRTLGRLAGLRIAHGGIHILLVRDLLRQWLSYLRHTNSGTYYFINVTLEIIVNSPHDSLLRSILRSKIQLRKCREHLVLARFDSLDAFLHTFLTLHAYLYMAAFCNADVVINVSDIALSMSARKKAEADLKQAAGLRVDLSDAREPRVSHGIAVGKIANTQIADMIASAAAQLKLEDDNPAVLFVNSLLDRFIYDTVAM
jgi:hypothetical protein